MKNLKEGKAIEKVCPRCHNSATVISINEGICVPCVDSIKQKQIRTIEKAQAAFNTLINDHGDKPMRCSNSQCLKVATIKEANEAGWKPISHRMYLCENCKQAFSVSFSM